MNARELRERLEDALQDFEGDTNQVRQLAHGLAREARLARERAAELESEAVALRRELANVRAVVTRLKAEAEGSRAAAENARNERGRAEAALSAKAKEPFVDIHLEDAWKGLRSLMDRGARPDLAEGNFREELGRLFGFADAGPFTQATDDEILVLLHLGFSEFQLLATLSGKSFRWPFKVIPPKDGKC
jgi:hypothetical protein